MGKEAHFGWDFNIGGRLMKSWCDLSWREKCNIKSGNVNEFNYLSGYDFRVKTKVQEGIKRKNEEDSFTTTAGTKKCLNKFF